MNMLFVGCLICAQTSCFKPLEHENTVAAVNIANVLVVVILLKEFAIVEMICESTAHRSVKTWI